MLSGASAASFLKLSFEAKHLDLLYPYLVLWYMQQQAIGFFAEVSYTATQPTMHTPSLFGFLSQSAF